MLSCPEFSNNPKSHSVHKESEPFPSSLCSDAASHPGRRRGVTDLSGERARSGRETSSSHRNIPGRTRAIPGTVPVSGASDFAQSEDLGGLADTFERDLAARLDRVVILDRNRRPGAQQNLREIIVHGRDDVPVILALFSKLSPPYLLPVL